MNEKMSNSGFDLNFCGDFCDEHFPHAFLASVIPYIW